uniref:GDT1 family protein n=1 Tax=Ixodes ricinus TaxID=34613 RepID=V5GHE5_IXORI
MAMQHAKSSVIVGAFSANVVMTVLSAMVGSMASVLQKSHTHYLSVFLLLLFGARMIAEDDPVQFVFGEIGGKLGSGANVLPDLCRRVGRQVPDNHHCNGGKRGNR